MIFVVKVASGQNLCPLEFIKPSALLTYNHFNTHISQPAFPFIQGNFYALHVGFMCKKENLFEKFSGIPFRIRLGGLTCNNRLEGKTVPITGD